MASAIASFRDWPVSLDPTTLSSRRVKVQHRGSLNLEPLLLQAPRPLALTPDSVLIPSGNPMASTTPPASADPPGAP